MDYKQLKKNPYIHNNITYQEITDVCRQTSEYSATQLETQSL